jgi:uncharacterized protein YraI
MMGSFWVSGGLASLRNAIGSPRGIFIRFILAFTLIIATIPPSVSARQEEPVPTAPPEGVVDEASSVEDPSTFQVDESQAVVEPAYPKVSAVGAAPIPLGTDLSLLQQNPEPCLTLGIDGLSVWIYGSDAAVVGAGGVIVTYPAIDGSTSWEAAGATILGAVVAGSDGAGGLPAHLYDYRPFGPLPADAGIGSAASFGTALFCVYVEAPPVEPIPAPTETLAPPPEPTEIPPAPTEIPPSPTQVPPEPTDVPPAPTQVPTEVPQEPTATPTQTVVSPTEPADPPTQSEDPEPIATAPITSSIAREEQIVSAAAVGNTVRTTTALNMRSAPGTTQPVVTVLPAGTTGNVLGGPVAANGYDWWRISTTQGTGWVAGRFLETVAEVPTATTTASLATTPSPTITATSTATPAGVGGVAVGATVKTIAPLNLRSGPSTSSPVLTVLPPETTGTILGGPQQGSGFTWWRIQTPNGTGWAAGSYLTLVTGSAGPTNPTATSTPAASSTPTPVIGNTIGIGDTVRVTAPLNMRSTASTSGTVVTVLPVNTAGTIVGGPTSADGYTWFRIETSNGTGWVVSNFIQRTAQGSTPVPSATATATVTVPATIPNPQGLSVGDTVRTTTALNLRSGPSTTSSVIAVLLQGTQGTILGGPQAANGYTWWRIQTPNGTGWVAGNFLTRATGQPTATPTIPPGSPSPTSTPTTAPSNPQGIKVGDNVRTTTAVNMRSAPTTAASVITVLPQGTQGTVLGGPETATGYTWWRVQTTNGTGWVAGNFLSIGGGGSGPPTNATPTPTPPPHSWPPPQHIDPYHMGNPSGGAWPNVNRWNTQILAAVNQVQSEQGIRVPPNVVKAVMMIESGGVLHPANHAGYGGLMGSPARPGAVAWTSQPVDHDRVVNDPFYSVYIGVDELANWYRGVGTGSWEDAAAAHFSGWNYNKPHVSDGWNTVAQYRQKFRDHITVLQAS